MNDHWKNRSLKGTFDVEDLAVGMGIRFEGGLG